jgi:hypothetical protein
LQLDLGSLRALAFVAQFFHAGTDRREIVGSPRSGHWFLPFAWSRFDGRSIAGELAASRRVVGSGSRGKARPPPERIRARPYRCLADDPESRLTLRQANQARSDFAEILDEQDFAKAQLQPDRAWLRRTLLLGFGSTAMFGPAPDVAHDAISPVLRGSAAAAGLRATPTVGWPSPF